MNITVSYDISKSQIENFEGLVSEVFRSVLEIGRELVREALEQADDALMESRDRERYRCKGFQRTCIKTKLGAVEYKRRVYVDNAAAEKQHCVHLLDEALDIKKIGLVSTDVCQLAAEAVCQTSYRGAAELISEATGLDTKRCHRIGAPIQQLLHAVLGVSFCRQKRIQKPQILFQKRCAPFPMEQKLLNNILSIIPFRNLDMGGNRKTWYWQEHRDATPFLCSYMGRGDDFSKPPFRFILNHSDAVATNSYLMLYPKEWLAEQIRQNPPLKYQIWTALKSITGLDLTHEGRVYGGGLKKIEPKELRQVNYSELCTLLN